MFSITQKGLNLGKSCFFSYFFHNCYFFGDSFMFSITQKGLNLGKSCFFLIFFTFFLFLSLNYYLPRHNCCCSFWDRRFIVCGLGVPQQLLRPWPSKILGVPTYGPIQSCQFPKAFR